MKNCPTCQATYPTHFAVCPQDGTLLVEVGAWAEGSVIRGKYRILSKIGQGGMGAVYKALHLAFDELRALKVMAPELLSDQLFVKRFKHEAVITRRLQHPNAVRVDDIDESDDGRPFIVMEYIEGRSLKKLIQDEGPLPVPRVCSIIKQVAAALDAAHRLGMIHRDIKPENIVLVATPEGEEAKVLDFGIAKVKEARLGDIAGMTLTGTGVVIGTPQYMSPEQAMGKRGDELDGRSDLYSLGIVMYQMLTADLPFKADTTMEMLLAHMNTPPTPICVLRPELRIPETIANLTMKLLEKNRELRPASARALIEEVEAAEQVQPPVGATHVARPTAVVTLEEVQVAKGPVGPGSPGEGAAAVASGVARAPARPVPPPAAVAVPKPAASVQPAVITPPARESQWGLWVALGILVVALAGSGWYFMSRRQSPGGQAPTTETSTPLQPQKPSETQAPPQTSSGPASSTPDSGRSAAASQPESAPVKPIQGSSASSQPARQAPSRPTRAGVSKSASSGINVAPTGETLTPRPTVDPQKIKAALTLGDMFYGRGEYDAAISAYQEGLDLDPSNAELRSRLERVKKAKAAEQRVLQ